MMAKRIYNHIPDRPDTRDKVFAPMLAKLPASVDLRHLMPPVFDQGQLGSCTANGILGLRGYYMLASGLPYTELSRLFLYWHERDMEGTVDQDSGAMIRDGMKTLQQIGCAPEGDYPYNIAKFTDKPSAKAEQDAVAFRIDSYHRVMKLSTLKAALAQKQPVVFGFNVYESFESIEVSNGGIVPIPDTSKEQLLGGHCVVAVGYDDAKQRVIVRNSWGTYWGDHGYCYMPYAMFTSGIVTDMWVGKLNAPKLAADVPFLDAINHYAQAGVIDNPPTVWIEYDKRSKSGTLTQDDSRYVELLVSKLAARDETLTEL